jgi:hypothetical protein
MAPKRANQSHLDVITGISRSLLALKLKAAAVRTGSSAKAAREAERAADQLESLLPALERGLPGEQFVTCQVVGKPPTV